MGRTRRRRFLLTGGFGGSASALLASDAFTAANDTAIESHTPDTGGAWSSPVASKFVIQTNAARGGGVSLATIETNQADVVIQCNVKLVGNGACGILARYASTTSYLFFGVSRSFEGKLSLVLYSRTAGGTTLLVRTNHSDDYATGVWHTLKLSLVGSEVRGEIAAKELYLTYTTTQNQTATVHGIRSADAGDLVDDFSVTRLTQIPALTDPLPIWNADMVRYAGNPVITTADTETGGVIAADPYLAVIGDVLYIFFESTTLAGVGQVWMAQSVDGFTWTDFAQVSTGVNHYAHPTIYEEGGTVHIYMQNEGGFVRHRSSPVAGFPVWTDETTVFDSATLGWSGMNECEIFKHGDAYYLLGVTDSDTKVNGLSAATLTADWNTDGTPITGNPLITMSPDSTWLSTIVEIVRVQSDGRLMFYFGAKNLSNVTAINVYEVATLTAAAMTGRWKINGHTFPLGAAAWESQFIHHMSAAYFGGRWVIAYDGRVGAAYSIGVATR